MHFESIIVLFNSFARFVAMQVNHLNRIKQFNAFYLVHKMAGNQNSQFKIYTAAFMSIGLKEMKWTVDDTMKLKLGCVADGPVWFDLYIVKYMFVVFIEFYFCFQKFKLVGRLDGALNSIRKQSNWTSDLLHSKCNI